MTAVLVRVRLAVRGRRRVRSDLTAGLRQQRQRAVFSVQLQTKNDNGKLTQS